MLKNMTKQPKMDWGAFDKLIKTEILVCSNLKELKIHFDMVVIDKLKQFITDNFISKSELEKIVPKKQDINIVHNHKWGETKVKGKIIVSGARDYAGGEINGWNACREQIKARIKKLTKPEIK